MFLWILNKRLNGLPLSEWGFSLLGLTIISAIAGIASWGVSWLWEQYIGSSNLGLQLLQLSLGVVVALGIFGVLAMQLKLPEVDILADRIKKKLTRI
jgi:putative peptidoglycan lipid II flippase